MLSASAAAAVAVEVAGSKEAFTSFYGTSPLLLAEVLLLLQLLLLLFGIDVREEY